MSLHHFDPEAAPILHPGERVPDDIGVPHYLYGERNGETPHPGAPREERRLYKLSELANLKSASEDAVTGGGIGTRGGKILVHAPAGVGKTTLLDHLLASCASGRSFLGRFRIDRPRRVLGIQGELAEPELASHGLPLLSNYEGTPASENLTFWLETQLRLPRCYAELRAVVRDTGAEVVALDPFLEFFEGESSDKPEQVQKVFGALDQLMRDEPTVELLVVGHHSNVTALRTAGSWKFEGWPSTILRLEKVPGVQTDRMLVFEKVRAPGFGLPEKIQIRLSDAGYLPLSDDHAPPPAGAMVAVLVLREAGGQLRRQELIERVMVKAKVKLRAAAGYIGQAKQEGLIDGAETGREVVYRVSETAS